MTEQSQGLKAFINLLETVADNKFLLGDRLIKIGVSGPRLESTLSAIAMAQGELGHARLLYNWSLDLKSIKGKKQEIDKQTGKAFKFIDEINDWLSLIAALYTISLSVDIVLKSVIEAGRKDVISRIHKLVREQKEHLVYARNWAQQLIGDKPPIQTKFNGYLNNFIPEIINWLQLLEEQNSLVEENYLLPNASLKGEFERQILVTKVLN